jgi:hypothetical protein
MCKYISHTNMHQLETSLKRNTRAGSYRVAVLIASRRRVLLDERIQRRPL